LPPHKGAAEAPGRAQPVALQRDRFQQPPPRIIGIVGHREADAALLLELAHALPLLADHARLQARHQRGGPARRVGVGRRFRPGQRRQIAEHCPERAVRPDPLQEDEVRPGRPCQRPGGDLHDFAGVASGVEQGVVILADRRAGAAGDADEPALLDEKRPDQHRPAGPADDHRRGKSAGAVNEMVRPRSEKIRRLEQDCARLQLRQPHPVLPQLLIDVRPAEDLRGERSLRHASACSRSTGSAAHWARDGDVRHERPAPEWVSPALSSPRADREKAPR
jgi:hypothetical protein